MPFRHSLGCPCVFVHKKALFLAIATSIQGIFLDDQTSRAKTARLTSVGRRRSGQRVCWLCQSHPFPPWVPSSSRPTPQPYLRAASTGRPIGWLRGRTTSSGPPSPLPHSASAASGASSVAFASTSASTFATASASAASLAFSTAIHIFVASTFIPSGPTALARRSWRRGGRWGCRRN